MLAGLGKTYWIAVTLFLGVECEDRSIPKTSQVYLCWSRSKWHERSAWPFCQLPCHMLNCGCFHFFLQAMVMATCEKEALPQTVAVAYQKNVFRAPPCQPTWRIAGKLEAFSCDCSSLKPPVREHLVQIVGVSPTSGRAAKGCQSGGRMTNTKLRGCCGILREKRKI